MQWALSEELKNLYLISASDVTSMTESTSGSGTFDTITLASSSAVWYEFQGYQDTVEFRETAEGEGGAYVVTQEIELFIPPLSLANRDAIQDIMDESDCGLIAAIKDANDIVWIVGYSQEFGKTRPCRLVSDNTTTNKVFNEKPGSTIVLRAISPVKAYNTTASIVTS